MQRMELVRLGIEQKMKEIVIEENSGKISTPKQIIG